MRYLFNKLSQIKKQLKYADRILLALDYDGTLTPIVLEPKQAILDKRIRNLLMNIAKKEKFTVAVISGRRLKNIKKLVAIDNIFYAGCHGFQIEGPGLRFVHPSSLKSNPYIQKIKSRLKYRLRKVNGIILEDKRIGLSLHYRKVKRSAISGIKRIFKDITSDYIRDKKIKVSSGKMVLEARPHVLWNKAMAVKTIERRNFDLSCRERKSGNYLTIYIGDDLTDEDVFRRMKDKDISIYVGKASYVSAAKYFLKNTLQVKRFLEILERLDG